MPSIVFIGWVEFSNEQAIAGEQENEGRREQPLGRIVEKDEDSCAENKADQEFLLKQRRFYFLYPKCIGQRYQEQNKSTHQLRFA